MSKGGVHNALSRGVLPSALSRAVGDMEGSAGLERYGETLTPILDLWHMPEWAYLRREARYGWENSPSAVAGEFSGFGLVNPADSGNLVVVERVHCYGSATQAFLLMLSVEATVIATFGASALPVNLDTRVRNALPGRARFYMGSDAALLATRQIEAIIAVASLVVPFTTGLPVILDPGTALVVQGAAVNQGFAASVGYRERKAFPGELE